jgi:hypothetical protein
LQFQNAEPLVKSNEKVGWWWGLRSYVVWMPTSAGHAAAARMVFADGIVRDVEVLGKGSRAPCSELPSPTAGPPLADHCPHRSAKTSYVGFLLIIPGLPLAECEHSSKGHTALLSRSTAIPVSTSASLLPTVEQPLKHMVCSNFF